MVERSRLGTKAYAAAVVVALILGGLTSVAGALVDLPERVPIPTDGNEDGVPDSLAAVMRDQFCARDQVRRDVFDPLNALLGGAAGRCDPAATPGDWTWEPAPATQVFELTIPDPNQDFTTVATPVDLDGDGVPSSYAVSLAMLRVTGNSRGEFTYTQLPVVSTTLPGPDPNDDPSHACATSVPLPVVGPIENSVVPNPDGDVVFALGARIVFNCVVVADPVYGRTGPTFPKTIENVPKGTVRTLDADQDGVPGVIIVDREHVTITGIGEEPARAPATPLYLPGVDQDDGDPNPVGFVFTRDTDQDEDSDWAELVARNPIQNPAGVANYPTAWLDPERTLDDPDGDGYSTRVETESSTNPDDPRSHPNTAPVLSIDVSNATGGENEVLQAIVVATDRDQDLEQTEQDRLVNGTRYDVPDLTCDFSAVPGVVVDDGEPGRVVATWVPTYLQGRASPYPFSCTATDHGYAQGGSRTAALSVSGSDAFRVSNVNDPPTIGPLPSSVTVAEAGTASVPATFTDPDGDALVVTVGGAPWASWSAATNSIVLAPGHDAVRHPATSGTFTVTVTVRDGTTDPVTGFFSVVVSDVNRPPTISFSPVPAAGGYTATENVTMTPITVVIADPDAEDSLTLARTTPSSLPSGMLYDAGLRRFTWTPNFAAAGAYDFAFSVSDGLGASASDGFRITVQNVNRSPAVSCTNVVVNEGATGTMTPAVSDPDGEAVTVTIQSPTTLPAWATFNGSSRLFTAAPGYDVVTHPAGSSNTSFTFAAQDTSGGSATATCNVRVNNVNRLPSITPPTIPTNLAETGTLSLAFGSADPDSGDTVTLTMPTAPQGATFSSNSISWLPGYGYVAHPATTRSASFVVRATDRMGGVVDYPFSVTVDDVNRAPTLVFGAPVVANAATVAEGATLSFTVTAIDPDGDTVAINATGLPATATFTNGLFSYSPGYGVVVHPATSVLRDADFSGSDGFGATVADGVDVTVADTNRAPSPTLVFTPRAWMLVGVNATIQPSCAGSSDLDPEDTVTCTWTWGDGTANSVGTSPSHNYTTSSNPDAITLVLSVTDGAGGSAMASSSFRVYAPSADSDADGLTNQEELTGSRNVRYGNLPTHPDVFDTDGDSEGDGREVVERGTDPNNKRSNSADRDGDGIPNGIESLLAERVGVMNPDNRSDPVRDGLPWYNGRVLLGVAGDPTRAHLIVYYDFDADEAFGPDDIVLADTDLLYTLDPVARRVTVQTPEGALTVEAGSDGTVTLTLPGGTTIVIPEDLDTLVSADPCAVPPVTETPGGYAYCVGADVFVAGMPVAERQTGTIESPLPFTLPAATPSGDVDTTPPDFATGTPARVSIGMEHVTIEADGTTSSTPAPAIVVDVGPSVLVEACDEAVTTTPTGYAYCLGADVTVEGQPIATRQTGTVTSPLPFTLPVATPAAGSPNPVVVLPPDFETGARARVVIAMEYVTIERDGTTSSAPATPIATDVGPSILVEACDAPVTPTPAGVAYCVGADITVDGETVAGRQTGVVETPLPFMLPVDTPTGRVDVAPADFDTGAPARVTIEMERVTVEADGSTSSVPADAIESDVGPSILVDACEEPVTTTPGGVTYCLGADVTVAGMPVASKQTGTVGSPLPFTFPLDTPSGFVDVAPPDLGNGAPARVTVGMERVTIGADGSVSRAPKPAFETDLGPSVLVDACGDAVTPTPTGVEYCIGADVTVDGMVLAEKQSGAVTTPLPFTLPADTPTGMVDVSPPDFATGAPAHVTIFMARVTIEADGSLSSTPATPIESDVGPSILVDACEDPVAPAPDGTAYCVGADVTVDGAPVAERQEGTITTPLPFTFPSDTPSGFVDVAPPNFATGAPTRITVGMERVTIGADGSVTRAPASSSETDLGPSVLVDACGDAVTPTPTGVAYCIGADVIVDGTVVAEKQSDTVDTPLPFTLPVDTPTGFVDVKPADFATGAPAHVEVGMERLTIEADGSLTRSSAASIEEDVGPSVLVDACNPILAPSPTGYVYCIGADVTVDGTEILTKQAGTIDAFPFTLPADTPAVGDPNFVSASPADFATGAPASLEIKMERVTIHQGGATTSTPAPSLGGTFGPSILVDACEAPFVETVGGGVDYCLGADVTVDGERVATKQEDTVGTGLPFTLPVDTPAVGDPNVVAVLPPNFATGTPASVTILMERVTVHEDGTITRTSAPPVTRSLGPSVVAIACTMPVAPAPGGYDVCIGADVFVDGTPAASRQTAFVPSPFPLTAPADTPVPSPDAVTFLAPDPATGGRATITIAMERVTIHEDGSRTSTAATPVSQAIGPSVLVVPCAVGDVVATPEAVDYCLGADVTVDGGPVATKQEGSIETGLPYTLPAATPAARDSDFLTYTAPDPLTGQAGSLTIKMERLTIQADGTVASAPATPVTIDLGPAVLVVPCSATLTETPAGVEYCVGADVTVDGEPVAERQSDEIALPFPLILPADTPAAGPDVATVEPGGANSGDPTRVTIRMERVRVERNGDVGRDPADSTSIAIGPGVKAQILGVDGATTENPHRFDKVRVTLWFDRDNDGVRDANEEFILDTPGVGYDRLDEDRDAVPDSSESTVCQVESQTTPEDGYCIEPARTDYVPPPQAPRRT